MNPLKVTALLLVFVTLGAIGMAFSYSIQPLSEGPYSDETRSLIPEPLRGMPMGCLSLLLFATAAPFALMPALAGAAIWYFAVRKQSLALEQSAATAADREAGLQGRLDAVAHDLLARREGEPLQRQEIETWTRGLDAVQQARVLRLATRALAGALPARGLVQAFTAEKPAGWSVRAFAFGLSACGFFGLLWIAMSAYSVLYTEYPKWGLFQISKSEATDALAGCLSPCIALLLGGAALGMLIRREETGRRRREAWRERAREVCLQGWMRRITDLAGSPPVDRSPERPARLAEVCLAAALAEFDGRWKARLLVRLRDAGTVALPPIEDLDLRQAPLTGADLGGLSLPRADLTGATLARARLGRAVLVGGRLLQADLRGADAAGADLRHADLRFARLHRTNLRQADLRGADLTGANLWGADLTGADLREAKVTPETGSVPASSGRSQEDKT
jgi:hypothetical protein